MTNTSHIQVFCRIRPKAKNRDSFQADGVGACSDKEEEIINIVQSEALNILCAKDSLEKLPAVLSINGKSNFSVDQVFDKQSQDEVFEQSLQPLLSDLFKGMNCTLFTYGQTGSGKTHTVIGGNGEERGLLPRAVENIFARLKELSQLQQTIVKLSFIEIYHEKLHDLLSIHYQPHKPTPPSSSLNEELCTLAIRQATDGTIFVENLQEIVIQSAEEFQKHLSMALKKRTIGSHRLNQYSSRSHLCCLIDLIQYQYSNCPIESTSLVRPIKLHSKLSIIDLAGSEMAKKTEATGQRFNEAKFINKSLSALSKVIGSLAIRFEQQTTTNPQAANSTNESLHIPYRDSKLTRLLQNSLGGNSKTIIILTVSNNRDHIAETISTLKFGERARLIKVTPQINRDVPSSTISAAGMGETETSDSMKSKELNETISQLKEQVMSLNQIINDLRNDHLSSVVTDGNEDLDLDLSMRTSALSLCQLCQNSISTNSRVMEEINEGPSEHDYRRPSGDLSDSGDKKSFHEDLLLNSDGVDDSHLSPSEDGEEEAEEEEEEMIERCAICGLNALETAELKQLTSEDLGFLFNCDGNCGNKFHIRCVGVVGEGGQFTLPEGEWFCNDCTIQLSEASIQREKDDQIQYRAKEQQSTFTPVKTPDVFAEGLAKGAKEEGNISSMTESVAAAPRPAAFTTHYKEVLIYMNLITTLQQKYNIIRKERNRILNHFQNEKKMFQQLELMKNNKIEQLMMQNLSLQERNEALQDQLFAAEKEKQSLLQQLQQHQHHHSHLHHTHYSNEILSPQYSHQGIEGTITRTTTASTTTQAIHSTGKSVNASNWISFTDSQELHNVLHGLYLSSTADNHEEEAGEDGDEHIPTNQSLSTDYLKDTRSDSIAIRSSPTNLEPFEMNDRMKKIGNEEHTVINQQLHNTTRTSETHSNDENRDEANVEDKTVLQSKSLLHRKQQFQFMKDLSLPDYEDDSKKIPKPWLRSSPTATTTAILTQQFPPSVNHTLTSSSGKVAASSRFPGKGNASNVSCNSSIRNDHDSDPSTAGVSSSSIVEPSRFVNPLKNRLSELLDLVHEEKHSFQEIRSQYQQSLAQNKERNQRRN